MQRANFECERCGAILASKQNLQKHMLRKNPCVGSAARHRCDRCGRTYGRFDNLARHAKGCALLKCAVELDPEYIIEAAAPLVRDATHQSSARESEDDEKCAHQRPTVMNNTNVNINQVNVQNVQILAVGAGGPVASLAPRGWPRKWPPPPAEPSPFEPTRFAISLETLRRAIASKAIDAEASKRGDPAAVARLLVEIVRVVQEDPRERNMYINPKRADQVLVYMPDRWEVRPLLAAVEQVLGHAAEELTEATPNGDQRLRNLAQEARKCFRDQPGAVVKSSRAAMATHLQNMQLSLGASECWLGEHLTGPTALRMFCRERHGHLDGAAVVEALGRAAGVFGEADFAGKSLPEMARPAMMMFARMRLAGRPENLTSVMLSDGTALVQTARGWESRDAGEAAAEQAADVAIKAADFIRGQPDVKYMQPLADYMAGNAGMLAAEEAAKLHIMTQCSLAAERHYGRTVDEEHAELRERIASSVASRMLR